MTFAQAQTVLLPFGKYVGQTVAEVADSDEGLRYLDWLAGTDVYGEIREALDVYLGDKNIASEVERVLEEGQYSE